MTSTRSLVINTTFVVSPSAEARFIDHITTIYIPKATATGLMQQPRFYRIMHNNEDGSVSYAVQFSASGVLSYSAWLAERGEKLQRMTAAKFGHSVVGFVTQMEEIAL